MPKPDTEYRPFHHRLFDRYPAVMRGERGATFHLTELLNRALGGDSAMAGPFLADPAAGVEGAPAAPGRGPRAAREAGARLPDRLQADPVQQRLVPRPRPRPRRGRHRRGRRGRADRRAHRRRHACTRPTCSSGAPASSATDFLRTIRVTGRDGVDLHDVWRTAPRAYLGIGVPGFPNLFCIYGPNTNLGGSSIIGMMEAQAGWIAQVARRLADSGHRAFEVRRDVAERYDGEMQARLGRSVWAALRQLVPRRRPDHHQLAGAGRASTRTGWRTWPGPTWCPS